MRRAAIKLAVGTAILGGGVTAAAVAASDDPSTTLKICSIVPLRLLRDSFTVASIVAGTLELFLDFVRIIVSSPMEVALYNSKPRLFHLFFFID